MPRTMFVSFVYQFESRLKFYLCLQTLHPLDCDTAYNRDTERFQRDE